MKRRERTKRKMLLQNEYLMWILSSQVKIQWKGKAPPSKIQSHCPLICCLRLKECALKRCCWKIWEPKSSKSTPAPPQYPPPSRGTANGSAPYPMLPHPQPSPYETESNAMPFYNQQSPAAVQEYQGAFGSGRMRETAQFQQRFAPQQYYPVPCPQPRCFTWSQAGQENFEHCFRCGSRL